ncbi:monovalent cation/H(+) antiporter subunit G [Naasia sp. SYSU D00948]|uniref:monovalent cation/H(+) antiporter subunit G n=1 Tax=Naasia sp. SYSU D00948 TaxID=2817379 RepID=UPI001B3121C5|nr:monovalent cation/H(+) antiporter subunit G [Naasia sp. SYSU D00948]
MPVDWSELLAAILLLLGAVLALSAGIGVLRFPDALSRMHAATKPQNLGLIAMLAALVLASSSWITLLAVLPVIALQLITTPMAAHMLGRAGYRVGSVRQDLLIRDELEDDIRRAQRTGESPGRRASGRDR